LPMKKTLAMIGLSLAALLALTYAADYARIRYKVAAKQNPFGSVKVYRYYAVEEKARKTEYVFDRADTETCVHSLFPQLGYNPCWYVRRHTQRQTNL
jgi:hypothetical protein